MFNGPLTSTDRSTFPYLYGPTFPYLYGPTFPYLYGPAFIFLSGPTFIYLYGHTSIDICWPVFILPSVVDKVLHMKNEISCTTTALPQHYQGTIAALPRHYQGTITALPRYYQGTIAALPLHTAGRDTVTCSPAGHFDVDCVACREERFHVAPSPGMTTHSLLGCEHKRH